MKRLGWIIGVLSAFVIAATGSDSAKLIALHREVMEAHLSSDVEKLLASELSERRSTRRRERRRVLGVVGSPGHDARIDFSAVC